MKQKQCHILKHYFQVSKQVANLMESEIKKKWFTAAIKCSKESFRFETGEERVLIQQTLIQDVRFYSIRAEIC